MRESDDRDVKEVREVREGVRGNESGGEIEKRENLKARKARE